MLYRALIPVTILLVSLPCRVHAVIAAVKVIDCKLSSWSEWSPCTSVCGGGTTTRSRTIIQQPNARGDDCPAAESLTQEKKCNQFACFTFMLSSANWKGTSVWVKADGAMKKYEVYPYLQPVKVKTSTKVFIYLGVDEQGKGTKLKSGCVKFNWAQNLLIGSPKGEGPEYVSSDAGYNCGSADEHSMCNKVRKRQLCWKGVYVIKFPVATVSPTAFPTRMPTPMPSSSAPTLSPTSSPTDATTMSWQWMSDGVELEPNSGTMTQITGQRQGAAGEDLYKEFTFYFKAQNPSSSSIGITSGEVRDPETSRIMRTGRQKMDCMLSSSGSGTWTIYEDGSRQSGTEPMSYEASDRMAIGISETGVVSFLKNNRKFGECSRVLEFPVHVDVVLGTRNVIHFSGIRKGYDSTGRRLEFDHNSEIGATAERLLNEESN